jgi:hypothetical protein
MNDSQTDEVLVRELEDDLVRRFGVLLPSAALVPTLGYPSMQAYQQAMVRRSLLVPVFAIEKRRGRFALARDVAAWLVKQRRGAAWPSSAGQPVDAQSSQDQPTQ